MKLEITDEQAEILAHCAMCQRPLEVARVKKSLEAGSNPGTMFCEGCGTGGPRLQEAVLLLASARSAEIVAERARKAGLEDHYKRVGTEFFMRQRSEQN